MSDSASPVPADTEEAVRDLQDRLARFARAVFVVAAVLGLASLGTQLLAPVHIHDGSAVPHELVHVGALALVFSMWMLCRHKPMGPRALETIDAAFTLVICVAYSLLGFTAPADLGVGFTVLLATTYTLVGRSILVPSTFARTLSISAFGSTPAISYFVTSGARQGSADNPYILTLFAVLWCVFAVFASAANSRQLYGLRAKIREIGKLGQYTLEKKLGEGGMGVVYRASHAMLRRPTAIKLLLPDRSGKDALVRFEREVRRTAMLTHPNTVTVFDYGRTVDGIFYCAMELLEGASLEELVELDGPQPEERVIHLLEQVAASLAEAHDAGLIHRDIKPGNILLVDRGGIADLVKVVDFGLVKDIAFGARGEAMSEPALTVANTIVGTPLYIAPETMTAPDTVDGRTDLYALGAVGYWLLTGTHVFNGTSILEVCGHHLHSAPEPPSTRLGAPLSSDLEAVLLACLAKRPEDRPASAHVLRERLRACAAAGRWTHTRAAEWWAAHRHELRSGGAGTNVTSAGVDVHAPYLTVTRIADTTPS